ncbi:hypothetical protein F5Y18DRAFT_407941 [Xylariaceae sp. FL1019]|nr:hypothetical protein F5Y18DRAFT_407941 [Xylariaceae sp. FL1019]
MELTPIQIRGKRRRKGDPPPAPRSKRPRNKDDKKRNMKPRPKASDIQRSLPLEILEQIFWWSENVNLPKASPLLGSRLSGPPTLRKTFNQAFGPTWDVWFGCIRGSIVLEDPDEHLEINSYSGWATDKGAFGGNPDFQSAVLNESWVTIDLILDCWDIWVRKYARNRTLVHAPLWKDPGSINPAEPYDAYVEQNLDVVTEPGQIKEARHYFFHDYKLHRQFLEDMGNQWSPLWTGRFNWMQVHPDTRFPEALLTGPWDEAATQKLFWLVRGFPEIWAHRSETIASWEVTKPGYLTALRAVNITVLHLFKMLDVPSFWPIHVQEEVADEVAAFIQELRQAQADPLTIHWLEIELICVQSRRLNP